MIAKAPDSFTIALAQLNPVMGDIPGNLARARNAQAEAHAAGADLILFSELFITGYPPEDLVLKPAFQKDAMAAVEALAKDTANGEPAVLIGTPWVKDGALYNAIAYLDAGAVQATTFKVDLPNYGVFDEKRVFAPGPMPGPFAIRGVRIGVPICEDIWGGDPVECLCETGAEILLVPNGSPFDSLKRDHRLNVTVARVVEAALPLAYLNQVGGQDELVFDGNSFVMDAQGEVVMRAPPFEEGIYACEFARDAHGKVVPRAGQVAPELADEASVYSALVLGVRDYVHKHGFPGVVMGLSGGIDSALTLAIAIDALGKDKVQAVMMPSRYTSSMSLDDARGQAQMLGVKYSVLPIEGMFEATLATLGEEFAGRAPDATEENIQSRCRMLLLMGLSNKTGRMLLTTGNKSEMAVGYATLYGDMAGGFAPIKDCSKLLVYRLARYRNSLGRVIPERVIERAPSAELRHEQKDSDSLPPYEVLDPILEAFIEEDLSVDEIEARGFDRATIGRVLDLVKRNEYKRRQAPPGVRVSRRAFGRDWRYPITSGYRR